MRKEVLPMLSGGRILLALCLARVQSRTILTCNTFNACGVLFDLVDAYAKSPCFNTFNKAQEPITAVVHTELWVFTGKEAMHWCMCLP